MWICISDAFLSIVHKDCRQDELLVRARRKGDIEKVFPGAKVIKSDTTDYMFRAVVRREEVADVLATLAYSIDYRNFKNTVRDSPLHRAYEAIWSIMYRLQPAPKGRRNHDLF